MPTQRTGTVMACRSCWQVGIAIFLCLVILAALSLSFVYQYQKDAEISGIESISRTAVSARYSENTDASLAELRAINQRLVAARIVSGGILFDMDGHEIDRFGNFPGHISAAGADANTSEIDDRTYSDAVWSSNQLRAPYRMVARLDVSEADQRATSLIWHLAGIFLFATIVVCTVTVMVIRRAFLTPLSALSHSLTEAYRDPANAGNHVLPRIQNAEFSDIFDKTNQLLEQITASHAHPFHIVRTIAARLSEAVCIRR